MYNKNKYEYIRKTNHCGKQFNAILGQKPGLTLSKIHFMNELEGFQPT
jgi:hypothetical protein